MMSEQLAEGENEVQVASIWGQNELLEELWRCLWDQEARLIWPKGSQGRFSQFRSSILGSFLVSFWKTWETKTASIDEVCVRCTFGIEFWSKNNRFWYQIRTEGRSYFSISSEMRKVDFWTTVHVFWRFLLFSTTLGSRELEAKINFDTELERDINLALIFSGFWSQKSSEIGSKIDQKWYWIRGRFQDTFWAQSVRVWVEVRTPKMTFEGGGMREPKEGVQCHTPLKPHFMG